MSFFISKILIALMLAGGAAYLVYFLFIKKDAKEDKTEKTDDQDKWEDF
ncbi:hypothetical protein [Enterococcus pallens]|uniref:Uncharacterized protein n=1 Tax=Enterococcus pallens ATCC BAA-351 TaxID=1158607 RepID=R2SRI5_9ENTE|nr:hypothetical protein [Enterococcus pallens]EOH97875.1 hypothetical protein UAU_00543 [Enterococcus pallens ATCC BAA-351]EOU20706.1 hypothetical protein I588_01553 [Enterococcus pallens ATCC BAA-351]OJG79336.1 hypothetical protein RV10_GL000838 [Enterococcus pallens]